MLLAEDFPRIEPFRPDQREKLLVTLRADFQMLGHLPEAGIQFRPRFQGPQIDGDALQQLRAIDLRVDGSADEAGELLELAIGHVHFAIILSAFGKDPPDGIGVKSPTG